MQKNLPNLEQIKNYERIAKKNGTGIQFKDLLGNWRFQYVWKKGKDRIDNLSTTLLQVLSANLELSEYKIKKDESKYIIKNSIRIGLISFIFIGNAFLKGKRPLLSFYFENFYFKVGNLTLLKRAINKIDSEKMPFFSLIAIDNNQKWLVARGKGGGLAVWIID